MTKILGISKDGIPVYYHPTASHSHRPDLDAEVISKIVIGDRGFIRETVDMGRTIGVDHLVAVGDQEVCTYMRRHNHPGESKFVLTKEAQPTSFVTIIICQDRDPGETQGKHCLVTLFEGKPGEREPFDVNIQNNPEALKTSREFWAHHALVPTEEELKDIFNNKYILISSFDIAQRTTVTFKRFKTEKELFKESDDENNWHQEADTSFYFRLYGPDGQRIDFYDLKDKYEEY